MAHVLGMPALQVGHPMAFVILMEVNDAALHRIQIGLLREDQPWARDALSVTAARMRPFNASSSSSPPW